MLIQNSRQSTPDFFDLNSLECNYLAHIHTSAHYFNNAKVNAQYSDMHATVLDAHYLAQILPAKSNTISKTTQLSSNQNPLKAKALIKSLERKMAIVPNTDFLNLDPQSRAKAVFLLTANLMQHISEHKWNTYTDADKLQMQEEYLRLFSDYFSLDTDQQNYLNQLKKKYLHLNSLKSYRHCHIQDNNFTNNWIETKNYSSIHLVTYPNTKIYNCIAESVNIHNQWLWPTKSGQNYCSIEEMDQFYNQLGYKRSDNDIDYHQKNSVIVFGHLHKANQLKLVHAGRINEDGLYISKLGSAGTVIWLSPDLDSSLEYGIPRLQYLKPANS